MIAGDVAVKEFVQLLDIALSIAEKNKIDTKDPFIIQAAETTVKNLKGFRKLALSGALPRPSKGDFSQAMDLGLSREVGEWAVSSNLRDAVFKIEDYYKNSM
ncbi:hypothetical protein [Pseudomonas sp. St290]|uniref:hypothetical protein n=1 Tax=Pseudomonas sp. St290 TaxID=1602166 RepID=UPI001BB4437B|nr:hypothetical protein [Pseudomonas sp. St290]BBH33904.1 hypothetical protein PBDP_3441 [Pseudomonas sp. St290]